MHLMNNETNLKIVLSDMYVGFKLLGRKQAERRIEAVTRLAHKSKLLQGGRTIYDAIKTDRRRSSIRVLDADASGHGYEVNERELLLEADDKDRSLMNDAAHFVKYASCIYVKLRKSVIDGFMMGEEISIFTRKELFSNEYRMDNIGIDDAYLCYASFNNGMTETPYAILVDDEVKKVVTVVRGTRSLEDLVADLQFIPEPLAEVGDVCGFRGEGYYCHQGFLRRSMWIYNDIQKQQVLKTLYSPDSPFKNYPLVLCGHSLGAGVASILALMLRPAFPSLQCFAYEVSNLVLLHWNRTVTF